MTTRRLELHRDADETGVSGTGVVAEGMHFVEPDIVVLRWTSANPTSVVFHERGLASVEAVHGHGGKTRIVWLDDLIEVPVIPPEVLRLLGEMDGQLGLAVYRHEADTDRWKAEARELMERARKVYGRGAR